MRVVCTGEWIVERLFSVRASPCIIHLSTLCHRRTSVLLGPWCACMHACFPWLFANKLRNWKPFTAYMSSRDGISTIMSVATSTSIFSILRYIWIIFHWVLRGCTILEVFWEVTRFDVECSSLRTFPTLPRSIHVCTQRYVDHIMCRELPRTFAIICMSCKYPYKPTLRRFHRIILQCMV